MTGAEWLACADVRAMLLFVRSRSSDRKRRLFAAACCRQVWHLLADRRSLGAVEMAERFADGAATSDELLAAEGEADEADVAAGNAGAPRKRCGDVAVVEVNHRGG